VVRYHGTLFGKAFHVLSFLFKETFWNEQWEVSIHVTCIFEFLIQNLLNIFPYGVTPGLYDHASTRGRVFRKISGLDHLLVPFWVVFSAGWGDGGLRSLIHGCYLSFWGIERSAGVGVQYY
jgi:hypothetical protein